MDKAKVVYVNTIKYYSALGNKEILTFMTTWVNLKDIKLTVMSHTDKYYRISHMWDLKVIFSEVESRMGVARGSGEEEMGICCSKGTKFQLCKISTF